MATVFNDQPETETSPPRPPMSAEGKVLLVFMVAAIVVVIGREFSMLLMFVGCAVGVGTLLLVLAAYLLHWFRPLPENKHNSG